MNTESRSNRIVNTNIGEEDLRVSLKNKYGDESVFVVANEDLKDFPLDLHFNTLEQTGMRNILLKMYSLGFFADRWRVESNPRVRQLIPYVVIKRGQEIFCMRRLEGAGEARLHGKLSVGVGGHINPEDDGVSNFDIYYNNIARELSEEVTIEKEDVLDMRLHFKGVINDDSNAVSRDHLGLLFVLEIPETMKIEIKETDKYEGRFYDFYELFELASREQGFAETWTLIALKALSVMGIWKC